MSEVKVTLGFDGDRVERVHDVREGELAPWGLDDALSVVEKHHPRVDGRVKATGRAVYTHDVRLPGLLYGAILRSPYPAAKVTKLDLAPARALAGVRAAVVVGRGGDKPKDRVFFEGDEVAAVAAVSRDVARDALERIAVEYEDLPFVVDAAEAMKEDAPSVFDRRPNVFKGPPRRRGDVAAALAEAERSGHIVRATYSTQVQTHSALETHGVVARWEEDGTLTVWASTQGTFSVREELAAAFGLKPSQVRVIAEHVGGGFGAKFGAGVEGVTAARLAREAKAPVHLMLSRREEHLVAGNRPDSVQEMTGAIGKDGKITALVVSSFGTGGVAAGSAGVANPMIYAVPNTEKVEAHVVTNAGGARAFRAPGHPQGCFALESMIDELAHAAGLDPLEVRLANDPSKLRRHEWELGAKAIGWRERRNRKPGEGGPILRGIGCAATTWRGTGGPPCQVIVSVDEDGSVEARSGTQDIGTGTRTVLATIVAEELGLSGPEAVKVALGDTRDPFGPGSGGSRTAATVGPAARRAAAAVRRQLSEALVPALGLTVAPTDLAFRNGHISVEGGALAIGFAEAVKRTKKKGFTAVGERGKNLRGYAEGVSGCQFAEVEVDAETGLVRVLKVVAVQDMGTIIDRLTAESQVIGGVIQGVSYALLEERVMDRFTGRMVNANLLDYKLCTPADCPEIVPILVPVRAGVNECSMLGVGEPPTIPTAAAIANALQNATGVRVRSLPLSPWKVLNALAARIPAKKFF